jgi:hypothetical protein
MPMGKVMLIAPRAGALDAQSASLVDHIRTSLTIQAEMFRRILDGDPRPSLLLAEVLEDVGNRYLDLSEMVSAMSNGDFSDEEAIG